MCLCGGEACRIPKNHFCDVCGVPCYTALQAEDHCMTGDVGTDD